MNQSTRTWIKVAAITTGAVAVGLGTVLLARRRRTPDLGVPPPPVPPPLVVVDGFAIVPPQEDEVDPEASEGEIVRSMPGGTDGSSIDERQILLGPILQEVPPGRTLIVEIRLQTESEPPAIPGASSSPCYVHAERLELDDRLEVTREEVSYPGDCERLYKTGGRDYDVYFPNIRVVRRADGIYVRYTWIRFGHPQFGNVYYARDYTVTLRWRIV